MLLSVSNDTDQIPQDEHSIQWNAFHAFLLLLIILVVFGNTMVIFAVAVDRKLRSVTTNKFIASLAVSDLLVGLIVMPLSLYYKMHNDHWTLGYTWCQFHLVSGVFSTTASIVHLVAISLDRYFAIMFPTEYQRHSVSTSTIRSGQKQVKSLFWSSNSSYTKKSQQQKEPRYTNWIRAPTFLMVLAMMTVNTPPATPNTKEAPTNCTSFFNVPSNSSHSSYTSASGSSDTYRRISMNSYGSSLTDGTESTFECDSRRSSAWSTIRAAVFDRQQVRGGKASVDITVDRTGSPQKKMSTISRGKLRRIATQVTRAIRRKRRESMAIRRESRATRVVAAILIAFLICWIPYFCHSIFRGVLMGFHVNINTPVHLTLFVYTSWLGYAHSCFSPIIYMCLNKNFRNTMRKMMHKTKTAEHEG
ncbi:hypothetical protein CAEBREN_32657 [Caenorhabditis brenneri]|uniref:G-protein coupled receptors family 1 profile domain-containing protein n=1 Tax=Caenorhabditis brenneri TaxID=135651 RepID=G0PNY6_CAEBE|nr:hypothetical protein CAEBREN_32657 [Caenorhabditis brenneri]